jgi:Ca2+-binding EF-hand superfamily protein
MGSSWRLPIILHKAARPAASLAGLPAVELGWVHDHAPARTCRGISGRLLLIFPSICTVAAFLAGASDVLAQSVESVTYSPERLAFDAADTDRNGLVTEAELARDAAAGFAGLDTDRDERLSFEELATADELGTVDMEAFSRIDADGDGQLSFTEVMRNKTRAFRAANENQDAGLSFEEMVDAVAAEQGVAP